MTDPDQRGRPYPCPEPDPEVKDRIVRERPRSPSTSSPSSGTPTSSSSTSPLTSSSSSSTPLDPTPEGTPDGTRHPPRPEDVVPDGSLPSLSLLLPRLPSPPLPSRGRVEGLWGNGGPKVLLVVADRLAVDVLLVLFFRFLRRPRSFRDLH